MSLQPILLIVFRTASETLAVRKNVSDRFSVA